MTEVKSGPSLAWKSMPGWGIVANLLPPEIVAARRVKVLRKYVIAALAAVVLLGIAGYAYAYLQVRSATSGLQAEQARTTQLQFSQRQYSEVVTVQADTEHIKGQLSTLLANDVNVPLLVAHVLRANPAPAMGKLVASIDSAADIASGAASEQTSVLDTSGHAHIGNVTVGGTMHKLSDVALYVQRLSKLPGVVEVYPLSEQYDGRQVTYSITMTLTDQLYSKRYVAAVPASTIGGN